MMKRFLLFLLTATLLLGLLGCGNTSDSDGATSGTSNTSSHEHLFENATVTITPTCAEDGEQVATCVCGETEITKLPATGKHDYKNGSCSVCGEAAVKMTPVSSVYDADGDGKKDVYYFAPELAEHYANAVHVWAGDYDEKLSAPSDSSASGIPHWYVTYGNKESLVYHVTVPEDGLYEMVLHFRMKDDQERGTKYTINGGTDNEQVFETSHGFASGGCAAVRDPVTLSSYMYGIKIKLMKGENIIKIEQASASTKTQHYRDFYFLKVGEAHLHKFEVEQVIKEATCNENGQAKVACSCGKTKIDAIPATKDHNYVNEVCSVCGKQYVKTGIAGYNFLYDAPGFAGGTVMFNPEITDTYTFYWGDAKGKLADYTMLYSDEFYEDMVAEVTIQSFTAIPKGATKLMAVGAGGTTYTYDIPQNRLFGAGEELYSFGALSDVHQGNRYGASSIPYNHFVNASKILSDKGASLIGICGDISYANELFEYQLYGEAIEEIYQYNPKLPIYTVSGNHESKFTGFSRDWFLRFSRLMVYYDTDLDPVFTEDNDLDFVVELPDGSVMIYLNQVYYDYGNTASRLLDDYQLDWLGARLEQYKDRTVFLFFHTFLDGEAGDAQTSTGKEYSLPLIAGTVDHTHLTAYLTQYKNVVYFSGHSHQSFDLQLMDPKDASKTNLYTNIDNNEGTFATMVHIPSIAATRSGTGLSDAKNRSEGYIVHVYEEYIIFEGYDFVNNQTFAYANYIISK